MWSALECAHSLIALASITENGGQISMQVFYDKFSRTNLRRNDNICLQYLIGSVGSVGSVIVDFISMELKYVKGK